MFLESVQNVAESIKTIPFAPSSVFQILLPIAAIIFLSKLLSIGARKIGLPQVIGMLLTGVLRLYSIYS